MSTAKYERSGYSFAIFLVWCTLRLPTNVGRTNYDELLNFQIVFNTFYAINGFRDAFSAVALFLSFNGTGELYDAIGRFHFYFTEGTRSSASNLALTSLVVAVSPA
ncbi:Uncharacterised protein [Salmonella enterica subsp. enterica]|uniref:Uncharacterized protein n=1 Tax=Salmonella enterica I TaxID=59201 RepID=A0A447PNH5_SALET|nr:Uncharacterised protein [Salmonella enterica subsp. enterica]